MSNILFTPNTTKQDYFRRNSVRYSRPAALQVCPFDNAAEWTLNNTTAGGVTKATDTTEHPGVNNASIKIAVPAIGAGEASKSWRLYKDFTTPWDARDCTITIRYYCDHPYVPYGSAYYRAGFQFLMTSSTDPITNRKRIDLPLSPGWHTVDITDSWTTEAGTVDESAIRTIGIIYSANTTNGDPVAWNIWLDSITFTKSVRTKAGLILSVDDNYLSAMTIAKKFAKYGFRSMVFAEPNTWSGTSGRLTAAQLRECEKYGMLVCSHYQGAYFDSSGAPQTLVDSGSVHVWCRTVKQGMWKEGFRNGSEFVALPGGTAYQQSEDHIDVLRQYFSIIRGTGPYRTSGRAAFQMASTLSGAVVDKGGGLVGFPAVGHAFSTGMRVTLNGSTKYTATFYTVHADTSANEVVVTATYQAETFAGRASIYPWLPAAISPEGNISYAVHGANLAEPWWRWAINPVHAVDANYETLCETYIAAAIASKGIFEMFDHDFNATGLTATRLDTLLAYIKTQVDAGTLEVLTYEDLV